MTDYISREAAKKHIVSITTYDSENDIKKEVFEAFKRAKWLGGIWDAIRVLDDIPAADVRPIVHGKWILHDNGSATCSVCKCWQKLTYDDDNFQHYCGNCGAQMEAEE